MSITHRFNFLKNERNELHFLPLAKLPVLGRSHAFSRGEQNFKMKREREAVGHLRPTVEGTAENGPGQGHRPWRSNRRRFTIVTNRSSHRPSRLSNHTKCLVDFLKKNKFKLAIRRQVRETPPLAYANEKCELQDRHDLLQWISESQLKRDSTILSRILAKKWKMTVKILSTSSYWPTMLAENEWFSKMKFQ